MPDSEDIESLAEDVAQERARVDESIRQIKAKLTPGQLIDEVMRQGGEPARNALAGLGKTVAAHPIPVLLMGAALVWLALEARDRGTTGPKDNTKET